MKSNIAFQKTSRKNQYKLYCIFIIVLNLSTSCKWNKTNKTDKSENIFIAPSEQSVGLLKSNGRACYFDDVDNMQKNIEIKLELAAQRELDIVGNILNYAGLPQNFKIYRGNIDNAMATMADNHRLIVYNKELFTVIDKMSDSYWASVFILAHEIGHHLAYNISENNNPITAELEADGFATSILYKMGADANQVSVAINSSFISNEQDTKTHPAKSKRLETINATWKKTAEQSYSAAAPPDPGPLESEQDLGITKIDEAYDAAYLFSGFKGIILNVQPLKYDAAAFLMGADAGLKMSVLLTQTPEEERYKNNSRRVFLVYYTNRHVGNGAESFNAFFVPGRRMDFDITEICEDTDCDYIISKATVSGI